MRIPNKYLRNKHFREKNWKRARNVEHPFETICPSAFKWAYHLWSEENQIEWHFEKIEEQARRFENGSHRTSMNNASSTYRRCLNQQLRARERSAMHKLRNGQDVEFPVFKRDAAWSYW